MVDLRLDLRVGEAGVAGHRLLHARHHFVTPRGLTRLVELILVVDHRLLGTRRGALQRRGGCAGRRHRRGARGRGGRCRRRRKLGAADNRAPCLRRGGDRCRLWRWRGAATCHANGDRRRQCKSHDGHHVRHDSGEGVLVRLRVARSRGPHQRFSSTTRSTTTKAASTSTSATSRTVTSLSRRAMRASALRSRSMTWAAAAG
jgi:hypothetical protein